MCGWPQRTLSAACSRQHLSVGTQLIATRSVGMDVEGLLGPLSAPLSALRSVVVRRCIRSRRQRRKRDYHEHGYCCCRRGGPSLIAQQERAKPGAFPGPGDCSATARRCVKHGSDHAEVFVRPTGGQAGPPRMTLTLDAHIYAAGVHSLLVGLEDAATRAVVEPPEPLVL